MARVESIVVESDLRVDPERALEGLDWPKIFGAEGPVEVAVERAKAIARGVADDSAFTVLEEETAGASQGRVTCGAILMGDVSATPYFNMNLFQAALLTSSTRGWFSCIFPMP